MAIYHHYDGLQGDPVITNAAPSGTCPLNGYSASAWYESILDANSTGRIRVAPFPTKANTRDNFISELPPDFPKSVTAVVSDEVVRTQRTRDAFEKLRREGHVVLSPMLHNHISVTGHPKIKPEALLGSSVTYAEFDLEDFEVVNDYERTGVICGVNNSYVKRGVTSLLGYPLGDSMDLLLSSRRASGGGYDRGITRPYAARRYQRVVVDQHSFTTPSQKFALELGAKVQKCLIEHPWDTSLVTTAVAELNSGTWDLLTELGEARETISWLLSLFREGLLLVRDFKREAKRIRSQPGKAVGVIADELASLWLQFRYAFSPLGYSINDALTYFQGEFTPYETVRKGSNHTVTLEHSGVSFDINFRDRVFGRYRLQPDWTLDDLGFNPLATAWELTPLSFVVDWILNIGDLLTAIDSPNNVDRRGFSYSRQCNAEINVDAPDGLYTISCNFYEMNTFNPLAHVGLTMDLNMTWKRWLDAASLSWSAIRSIR